MLIISGTTGPESSPKSARPGPLFSLGPRGWNERSFAAAAGSGRAGGGEASRGLPAGARDCGRSAALLLEKPAKERRVNRLSNVFTLTIHKRHYGLSAKPGPGIDAIPPCLWGGSAREPCSFSSYYLLYGHFLSD